METCSGSGDRFSQPVKFGRGYYPRLAQKCRDCGKWVDVRYAPAVADGQILPAYAMEAHRPKGAPRQRKEAAYRVS